MATQAPTQVPPKREEVLCLAQEAFQKFHTLCFWHMRDDLQITEEDLPAIIKGLRENGTHETFQIAARLCH